jgi:adenosylhomocysteinase
MELMPSGAVLANSGHFDLEIQVAELQAAATRRREIRPNCVEYTLPGGNRVLLLAEGRLVGQSAAEAHPAEVMDMTFATQALALVYLAQQAGSLSPGVHNVPPSIERDVAEAKLTALGVRLDTLSDRQVEYLTTWRTGT